MHTRTHTCTHAHMHAHTHRHTHTHIHTHLCIFVCTQRDKLFDPQVWLEAATQIFFSLGVATGALIALASYSKPRYNTLVDSVIVCLVNSFTSIFAAITIFSVVGFKAERSNTSPELVSHCHMSSHDIT